MSVQATSPTRIDTSDMSRSYKSAGAPRMCAVSCLRTAACSPEADAPAMRQAGLGRHCVIRDLIGANLLSRNQAFNSGGIPSLLMRDMRQIAR